MIKRQPRIYIDLKYWRKMRALTIRGLAAKAHVAQATVSKIEHDPFHIPGPTVTRKLAAALGLEIEELLQVEQTTSKKKTTEAKTSAA